MSLKNYFLEAPSRVIGDDNRDPDTSWKNHLARTNGLRGGVDIVADIGTPIIARTNGTVKRLPNDGSAGNSMQFAHDDNPGWRDVFSHLSSYVAGTHFNRGDVIAYSGNTGGVIPHLHWHLLDPNGNRQNPWHYFSEDDMDYLGWSDQAKDALISDILNGTGRSRVNNWQGIPFNLIDILNGADRAATLAAERSQVAADAVTPGVEGVKFDGDTYAMAKRAAISSTGVDPVAIAEELANNPKFAADFGTAFAAALAAALLKGN